MIMRAYKFRIYPKKKQIEKINIILNLSYKLYNAMLEQRKLAYELNKDFSIFREIFLQFREFILL